jgi:hypothetical protein
MLQRQPGAQDAGGCAVRQQGCELRLEILQLGTRVATEPESQRAETQAAVHLAATAIKSWTIQVQSTEWRSVTNSMRAVSSKPHLTVRACRAALDRFAGLAFDHGALHASGHGLRFLKADTD